MACVIFSEPSKSIKGSGETTCNVADKCGTKDWASSAPKTQCFGTSSTLSRGSVPSQRGNVSRCLPILRTSDTLRIVGAHSERKQARPAPAVKVYFAGYWSGVAMHCSTPLKHDDLETRRSSEGFLRNETNIFKKPLSTDHHYVLSSLRSK